MQVSMKCHNYQVGRLKNQQIRIDKKCVILFEMHKSSTFVPALKGWNFYTLCCIPLHFSLITRLYFLSVFSEYNASIPCVFLEMTPLIPVRFCLM